MEKRLLSLLRLALKYKASDIHFTLRGATCRIELRVNEMLIRVKSSHLDLRLLRYLQYRANLDVGCLHIPQTGQFQMEVDGSVLSLRFALIASLNLTSGVLRILNANLKVAADKLSDDADQNAYFKKLFAMSYGLLLFSGPTGSGKTTSLYALLDAIKNSRKIYTIEDPIEVYNEGFVQLQVNESVGFDYAVGVAQILRHDPDVIMIGEIREEKAAKMAVIAANTGHLVVASLHCGSAAGCISRMKELGVGVDNLYEILLALSNQRLLSDVHGHKHVLYEIMDRTEIAYFRQNGHNSPAFTSIDEQYRKGVNSGLFKEE